MSIRAGGSGATGHLCTAHNAHVRARRVILNYLQSDLFRAVSARMYPAGVGIYRTMFFNKCVCSLPGEPSHS